MLRPWRSLLMTVLLIGVLQELTTAMFLTGTTENPPQFYCTGPAWEPPCGYVPESRRQKLYIAKKPTWPPPAAAVSITSAAADKHHHKLKNQQIVNNSTFIASWLMNRAERKEMQRTIKDQECIIKQQKETLQKLNKLTADCLQLLKVQDVRKLGNQLLVAKTVDLRDLDDLLNEP